MAKSGKSSRLIIIGVAVILGLAIAAYARFAGTEPPPAFNNTTVSRGEIIDAVTASGDIQPVVKVEVSSQVSGIIDDVMVDFNSPVKRGDVIAQLDPASYDSRLKQAEAQLANTRANHALVKVNHDRTVSLHERNLVSQQELDQVRAQLQQAEAQLLIQQAAVDNAKTDLARCTITAPIDGIVISRVAERGMTVAASLNAPTLFVIVNDLTKMQIVAAVAEADIGDIEIGQTATFTVDAFPDRQFRGRVSQIRNSPVVVQSVVSYNTLIDVSNEDLKLRPGMTANISIILDRRTDALRIPNSALRARIPDEFLPPPPAASGGVDAETGGLTLATREQMLEVMREAGHTPGGGRPSPEIMTKARALAAERGLALPDRSGRGGGGRVVGGGRPVGGGSSRPVTRLVYQAAGSTKPPYLRPVSVRLGITDGTYTEVLSGLSEGDPVVTGLAIPGSAPATAGRNPFTGGRRRF